MLAKEQYFYYKGLYLKIAAFLLLPFHLHMPYKLCICVVLPFILELVGVIGIEPTTFCSQSSCSTKLSYTPLHYVLTIFWEF